MTDNGACYKSFNFRDACPDLAKVGVMGMGYVGSPLSLAVAKAGYPVLGFVPADVAALFGT
jgi:UDP-N-acetyl-D-mannosaminuronate dehydrogenase